MPQRRFITEIPQRRQRHDSRIAEIEPDSVSDSQWRDYHEIVQLYSRTKSSRLTARDLHAVSTYSPLCITNCEGRK